MRKQNKNPLFFKRQSILLIAFLVLAALVTGAIFAWRNHSQQQTSHNTADSKTRGINDVDYSPADKEDNTANNARKGSDTPAPTLNNGPNATDGKADFSVTIVSANVSDNNVHIGTLVSGTTSGTCALTATQGQTTVNLATSSVKSSVNSYDCGVFNIPTSQLPNSGKWELKLTVSNNGKEATGTSSITI